MDAWRAFFGHRIQPQGGCLVFTGCRNADGYGTALYLGKVQKAHRISYTIARGPIPEGALVCHACDTPECVNPKHLWLGTNLDNKRDCVRKGRHTNPSPRYGSENPMARLTEREVAQILRIGLTAKATANLFGVSIATVHLIRSGKIWKHVPGERRGNPRKLTKSQAAEIRADPRSQSQIARDFGVAQSLVSQIKSGRLHAAAHA